MRRCCSAIALTTALAGCRGFGRDLSPIRLEPIVTLGATSGDGAIATTPTVSAHHPGGFWIVTPAASAIGTLPLIYGDDGKYLGALHGDSTLASSMTGPKFARLGPGDSIWMFDNSGRVLVFGPQRNFVRSVMLPDAPDAAEILPDNRIVVSRGGDPVLRLYGANASPVRVIGPENPATVRLKGLPIVFGFRDGALFTSSPFDHSIEQWDTGGDLRRTIDMHFDRTPRPVAASHDWNWVRSHPPLTIVMPRWIDAVGRVWLVGQIPDRHWQQALRSADSSAQFPLPADVDTYHDTIIEVRDLETGRVIAAARFDPLYQFVEPGVLAHVIRTSAGWYQVELVRIVFTESASRP